MEITKLRRAVQLIFFILILYSGFLGLQKIRSPLLPFIEVPKGFESEERVETLRPPAGYVQVFDTYLPAKSCRFIAGESRLFRACAFHFFSESLTWLTPLKYLLPHILLFVAACFLLGRFWCGWLCPLGFISDVLTIIRKSLKLNYVELPNIFQNALVKFKYILVSFILLISLAIALPFLGLVAFQKELFLVGCQVCPARILFPLLTGATPTFYSFDSPILIIFSIVGLMFLFIFFMSSFVKRFWCRFCPSGALISLFNIGGAITKEKDVKKCTKCGICARVCPLQNKNVYEEKVKKNIDSRECIHCFRCVDLCPKDECLKVKILGKTVFKSMFGER